MSHYKQQHAERIALELRGKPRGHTTEVIRNGSFGSNGTTLLYVNSIVQRL